MAYGKLEIIKTIGDRPIFALSDKEGRVQEIDLNIMDWLIERVGKIVDVSISNIYFSICDEEERRKV